MKLFNLKGKITLAKGSAQGSVMAKGLGTTDATLIVNPNSSRQKINEAVKHFQREGAKAVGCRFYRADEAQVIESIGKIQSEVGPMDFDLASPFLMSKHVVKGMIKRRQGKIITILVR